MPTLEVVHITKDFPAIRALDDVSFEVAPGEVRGIVGENGAGKSTLMKILAGIQPPTSGEIRLDGKDVRFRGVGNATRAGIGMIHQELNLVDELSVSANVFLGRELKKGIGVDNARMNELTRGFLADVSAHFEPEARVGSLSIANKQLVEIAKAISLEASILIMDEPTAVLSEPESEALFRLVARLKASGVTILYISHRLVEVCEICDRITVMRDGKLVTTTELGVKSTPSYLASQMVGRPLSDFYPPKIDVEEVAPLLEVESASVEKFAHDVSFAVRPGEILGFSGLIGSGRTELCEAIAGLRRLKSGAIKLDGRPVQIRNPRMAKKAGIAYVSEDRKALGLHQMLSVIDNTTLSNLSAYGGISVDDAAQRASTEIWKERLDIRANDLDQSILFLSGGNQQKVSIAKWLDTKPRVLILDEPTRGVDVGAKREIYALIQQLAANGMACLVISSELTEVIGLCHRALVFREGRVVGEVFGDSMNEETMMHLAAGVDAA